MICLNCVSIFLFEKNPIIFTEADLDRDGKYLNAAENLFYGIEIIFV